VAAEQLAVRVALTDSSLDDEALADMAEQLRAELAELDVDDVAPVVEGDAPPGTKAIDLLAVGALVVKFVSSRKVLTNVVDVVRDWMTRNGGGSIRLEVGGDVIELSNATADDRRALIDSWIERHSQA
jgi:hypothetical protein